MKNEHCISICNSLLRGERSAVETYDKAIASLDKEPTLPELTQIRSEHAQAVVALEENVRSMGGDPERESGAWGAFANAVQSSANVFGKDAALETLQTGEKSGKSDYESALEDDEVMAECKELIRSSLLPRVEEHIITLDRLQRAA